MPRIRVPTLFDEGWDSVVIATYGADLAFYERDLWRQIDRAKNRLIFADGRQVQRRLAAAESANPLRRVNRTYVLAPVRLAGAAHAKLILLLSEDRGLLAVGSGNLGMGGYASQGECFTTYHWSEHDPEHLHAFVAVKDFLDQLTGRSLVDDIVKPRLQQAWQDAPWIYGTVDEATSPVRHNLERPLLDQFIDAIAGRPVRQLVVHAPFYDHRCVALSELIDRTKPRSLKVLLQERITSVDPARLSKVLSAAPGQVEVRSVRAHEPGAFLHAKFVVAHLDSSDVCLQGSPNLSTPALLRVGLTGNIEIANLLEGSPGTFGHLVDDLIVSDHPVEISSLGLSLVDDEDESDDADYEQSTRELTWVPPRLTGVFCGDVHTPPALIVGDTKVDDVEWRLDEPQGGMTPFTAILGDSTAAQLNRVAAITFVFDEERRTAPAYPYHLNTLAALSSGQGRTDLLRQAGDFDLDDEELEQLLAQLDEVLIVDGRSLWRMLKRTTPESTDEDDPVTLVYDDIDWDAIRSHPKLAQYRAWDQRGHSDPTGLGILLGSIADRFRSEVSRRSGGEATSSSDTEPSNDPLDDLSKSIDAEDEETAEADQAEVERRRMSARTRARRQFRNFVKRFVTGLTDDEFVRLVGPSVIVPSYVVFNHLCWKLGQLDLIDRPFVLDAQVALWKFFWGDSDAPGYLSTMTEPEQLAAIDILDAHSAEAVLLASVFQAYGIAWEGNDADVVRLRDEWRVMLTHDLGGSGVNSVRDAAIVSGEGTTPIPLNEFVEELAGLAEFAPGREVLAALAEIASCGVGFVRQSEQKVSRGELGEDWVAVFEFSNPSANSDVSMARSLLSELARLLPDAHYLRVHHTSGTVAFADYDRGIGLWYDPTTDEEIEFDPPDPAQRSWDEAVDRLLEVAA